MSGDVSETKNGLPAEDQRTSILVDASRVNMDALSFMAQVPAKYLSLMGGIESQRAARQDQQRDETKKRDQDFADMAAELAQIRQQEIDNNVLKLNIGGEDMDISQGDLREVMEKRVKSLREEREKMARSGASADKLERMDNLIDQYDPLIDDLKNGKADRVTIEAVQELAKQDPELAREIKRANSQNHDVAQTRTTSFSAEAFATGAVSGSLSLRETFAKGAAPQSEPAPESAPSVLPPKRNLDSTLDSMGF